jgi:hypothetical protein
MDAYGFYVIHFADDKFGIVNLDYINGIKELSNPFARPFRYLLGLQSLPFNEKDDEDRSTKLQNLIKNFKVHRDTFYELIFFLKDTKNSMRLVDLNKVYKLGMRLGIGHMPELCKEAMQDFHQPAAEDNVYVDEFLEIETDEDDEEFVPETLTLLTNTF